MNVFSGGAPIANGALRVSPAPKRPTGERNAG
jgi:hypothetical protein